MTVETVCLIIGKCALVTGCFQGRVSVKFPCVGCEGAFRFAQGVQDSGIEPGKSGLMFGLCLFDPAAGRSRIGQCP